MMDIIYTIVLKFIFVAILYVLLEIIHKVAIERSKAKKDVNSIYWKWGIFYYNPDDPRMIVPKRIKWLGWSLNFAKPISVILLLSITLIYFVLLILSLK
jgi:uncharacterized membrane protein